MKFLLHSIILFYKKMSLKFVGNIIQMKKILFLFILISALSKAQNDSIMYFAYTDYNNNCIYEPGMGEEPLKAFAFTFDYKFSAGTIQSNTKPTDNNGFVKFYAPSAFSPATNTLAITPCLFTMPPQFSACFSNQDLPYNTTYSVGVYSPAGNAAFNYLSISDFYLSTQGQSINDYISTPGLKYYCIGKTNITANAFGFNYIGTNMSAVQFSLTFLNGSTDSQLYTHFTMSNPNNCAFTSGNYNGFANPELHTPGIYTVSLVAQGMNASTYTNSFVLVVDSCTSINGNVFVDCNSNCIKDANEFNCDEEVVISTNGTYTTTSIPDYNGNYSIVTPYSATQYTATIIPNTDFTLACSTPSSVVYTANAANSSYFANTLNQTSVNNINYSSYVEHPYSGSSVPGGSFKLRSYYDVSKPDFCSAVNNSGTYYIKLDQNTQLASVEPGTPNYSAIYPTSNGDSIVWNIADLRTNAMNLGGNEFVLNIDMKVTATIGLPYSITSGVISNVVETSFTDNEKTGTWLIGGPFDPNYIEVTPAGIGSQGYIPTSTTELYYTIHFQNVGNAPAINVKIKNQLDNNLDVTSIKLLGSSAPVQTNIDGNNLATFAFNHIMLIDSTHDEPNSHGFVSYKINLKPSLAPGTQISNTAGIYFDYNAAVLTNTVLNTIQSTTNIKDFSSNTIDVYPNPSNGIVNINSFNIITKINVINVLGEIVKSVNVNANQLVVDLTDLKSNVYFLQITDTKNQTSIKKIVRE
jgi:hypothetical protein